MKKLLYCVVIFLITSTCSCLASSLDIPIKGYGISFGNSRNFSGLRFNLTDSQVERVNGLNLTFWKPKENPQAEMNGFAFGLVGIDAGKIDGIACVGVGLRAGEMTGVSFGLVGIGANNITGLAIGGVGIGSKNIRGICVGGIGIGAEDMDGLFLGGIGIGAKKINGIAIGGISM